MRRFSFLFLFISLSLPYILFSQGKVAISGTITSAKTGETLIGASVMVPNSSAGTTSNEYGFYSLTLSKGNYTIEFSAIGLKLKQQPVQLQKSMVLNITLEENTTELETVVVKSTGRRSITNLKMGMDRLTIAVYIICCTNNFIHRITGKQLASYAGATPVVVQV